MSRLNVKKTVSCLLVVGWMLVIFVLSNQPAGESSQISGGIVSKIIAAFLHNFDSLSAEKQEAATKITTVLVRKTAHFTEYFILGILTYFAAQTYKKLNFKTSAIVSFGFCVIYAVSDEIHQYFIPGRACRFLDICIDSLGSFVSIVLLFLIIYFKKRRSGELNA